MAVKLNSTGGGSVTLDTPSTASNYTVTLPAATSTLIDTTSTQTLTNKTLTAAGSNTIEATSGPTSTQLAGQRNKIINGAMMIDQRNAGASVSLTTPTTYVMDRWAFRSNTAITVQRSTTAAIGFINSAYVTVPTGATSASGNFNVMQQSIEGFNVSDLNWGTANAKTVTLSFQVRSTQTGTFAGSIRNGAGDRSYVFTFAIASANTWTSISVTIAGDTTGTWAADNTAGLIVTFDLGSGSTFETTAGAWTAGNYSRTSGAVQLTTTSSANLYITGVQLEKGATATPFENRLYGTELALCQRYYWQGGNGWAGVFNTGTTARFSGAYPVQMRTAPTVSAIAAPTALNPTVSESQTGSQTTGFAAPASGGSIDTLASSKIQFGGFSSGADGRPSVLTNSPLSFSAEL